MEKWAYAFTMGEYDFVAIIDVPNEENMVEILMKLNAMDNFAELKH